MTISLSLAVVLSLVNFIVYLVHVRTIGAFDVLIQLMGWKLYAFQATVQVAIGVALFYYLPTFTVVTSAAWAVAILGYLVYFKIKQPQLQPQLPKIKAWVDSTPVT
jgi:hypothetical protein